MTCLWSYNRDIRSCDPEQNRHRRARFIQSYQKAHNGPDFTDDTLRELTWGNLGYRLAKLLGPADETAIAELYDWCVRQQASQTNLPRGRNR
jgi:hypothetical protein